MAKNKIERIDQEIEKTREKIAEYQEKLKTLEAQKTEAENLEIVQMVRALRMTCLLYTSELTPTLLREFVEKIVVHESVALDGKRRGLSLIHIYTRIPCRS